MKLTAWILLLIIHCKLSVEILGRLVTTLEFKGDYWNFIFIFWLITPIFLIILSKKDHAKAPLANYNSNEPREPISEKFHTIADKPHLIGKVLILPMLSKGKNLVIKHQRRISKIASIPTLIVVIGFILFIIWTFLAFNPACC